MNDHSKESHLSHWIEQWLSKNRISSPYQLVPLAGDGSQRTFYRLSWNGNQCILLSDAAWDLSKDYPAHQAYLHSQGIPVPEFLAVDPQAGILLMEDLGDDHLQKRLLADPAHKMEWLQKATALLAQLHGRTFPVSKELPVATRSFDREKYLQEMMFTFIHLHEGFLGLPPIGDTRKRKLSEFCATIAGIGPQVFSHRDYHVRNIMLHQENIYLIDFQDARLGPPHYDLASLIFDAYIPISTGERKQLLSTYRFGVESYPLAKAINWMAFEANLNAVALQRVIKAAGSFASFFTRYGKDTHLPYLKPSLQYASDLIQSAKGIPSEAHNIFPIDNWIKGVEEKLK